MPIAVTASAKLLRLAFTCGDSQGCRAGVCRYIPRLCRVGTYRLPVYAYMRICVLRPALHTGFSCAAQYFWHGCFQDLRGAKLPMMTLASAQPSSRTVPVRD